jgi:pimeloyl-ACP methyl ester carboxylesterase
VYWRLYRAQAAGNPAKSWREVEGWRGKAAYIGRLLAFALLSLLTISFTIMTYRNIVTVQMFTQAAPSQVDTPDSFPYALRPVQIRTDDGALLRGWLIEPEKPATIILLHGYGSNRGAMLWHAEQLAKAGLGVLLYDERATGESDGELRSYGWQDPADLSAALDFLETQAATMGTSYGAAGCSIGAQIALQAAAEDTRLKAVWADGPAIVRAADLPRPHDGLTRLNKLSGVMFDWFLAAHLGRLPPPALRKQLTALANRPVQFVAGGIGVSALGPEASLTSQFVAPAGAQASLWVIENSVHCDGPQVAPAEYSRRLTAFFQSNLLP